MEVDHTPQPAKQRRRRRRRPTTPDYLTLEGVFRRSFCDSFKEFIQHGSLAGIRQIADPTLSWFQRTIWGMAFCVSLGTIVYYLNYTWLDILSKPLIVTMESSNYPISSIDFPAVAICNINRIGKKALRKFATEEFKDFAGRHDKIEDVEAAILNWGRLINFSYNDTLRSNHIIMRMIEKYRFDTQRIVQIMKKLAPSCEESMLRCGWGGALMDCKTLFSMNMIANRGHCCTFNYWNLKLKTPVQRQQEAGSLYGLSVLMDPHLEDYAYPLGSTQGFDVMILDPSHFADPFSGRVTRRIAEPDTRVFLELKSTKQIATEEVRKYAIETRKCRFQDESFRDYVDSYSYSNCIVNCRIATIYSLCKCTPFFLALKDMQMGPVCSLEDLKCLHKYREKLFYLYPIDVQDLRGLEFEVTDSLFCPECLPDCELTQYSTKSYEIPLQCHYKDKEFQSFITQGFDMTNKSMLSIYHPLPDAKLDKLDVVLYWFEIFSNIGGFSGLVIGFSFICVVEIIYFLTIRFIVHFHINYHKYYI